MTRDGLVEKNLATGEETRATQRGQEFDLKQGAPERTAGELPGMAPDAPRRHAQPISHRPMEAARAVGHDIGARAHETPAGGDSPPKQGNTPAQRGRLQPSAGAESTAPAGHARLQFAAQERPPAPEPSPAAGRKLEQAQARAGRAEEKLAEAREKVPTKKKLARARVYDEQKNKAKNKLRFEETPLAPGEKRPGVPAAVRAPASAAKGVTKMAGRGAHAQFHRKLYEAEGENVGVQAAHHSEMAGEGALRFGARSARSAYRWHKNAPYRAIEKLEKRAVKAGARLSYRKALNDNPKLKSNIISRFFQKRKVKAAYAKAAREAKKAGAAAKKTGSIIGRAAKAVAGFASRHPVISVIVALILFLFFFLSAMLSSCSGMGLGGAGAVLASTYLAEDADIVNVELVYSEWETDLLMQVENAEADYPGYDEYRYNVDGVGHDPHELMAFLTATHQAFTFSDVQAELREIFEEQYSLTFEPEVELRTRTVRVYDPVTRTYTDAEEEYEWHILNVTLTARPFAEVLAPRIGGDELELYDVLMQTKGNRQYAMSPFAFDWLPYVTDGFGWRVHPITKEKDNHRGTDIAVPQGTPVIAAHDGVVSIATFHASYGNYIALDSADGLQTKYAHLNVMLVSAGQQVQAGDVIGRVGSTGDSTGPHLHFEVLMNELKEAATP